LGGKRDGKRRKPPLSGRSEYPFDGAEWRERGGRREERGERGREEGERGGSTRRKGQVGGRKGREDRRSPERERRATGQKTEKRGNPPGRGIIGGRYEEDGSEAESDGPLTRPAPCFRVFGMKPGNRGPGKKKKPGRGDHGRVGVPAAKFLKIGGERRVEGTETRVKPEERVDKRGCRAEPEIG
jgi:hypothetical protein